MKRGDLLDRGAADTPIASACWECSALSACRCVALHRNFTSQLSWYDLSTCVLHVTSETMQGSTRQNGGMLVSHLPCDCKVRILCELRYRDLLACLSTSLSWWQEEDAALWRELAVQHRLRLPSTHGRLLRSLDLRRNLLQGLRRQHEVRLLVRDELWSAIWGSDAAAKLRTSLDEHPLLDAAAPSLHHAGGTLLHLAARRNRQRCVRLLVERVGADIDARDDGGMTPLLGAAWAGHLAIVQYLLMHGADCTAKGEPPMSSVCGGKGAFTAEEWAVRKADYIRSERALQGGSATPSGAEAGFRRIARLLARARKIGRSAIAEEMLMLRCAGPGARADL